MFHRLCFVLCLVSTAGCFSPVHVRPARTLAAGEHEAGLVLSGASLSADKVQWYNGTSTDSIKDPTSVGKFSGMPEIVYHYGFLEDLEAGLRLGGGSGLAEADAQYRFLRTRLGPGDLHLSAGAIFGSALAGETGGGRALVPLRATYDFTENWGVTLGGHAGYRWVKPKAVDPNLAVEQIDDLRWLVGSDGLTWGGGVSADWRNDDWVARLFYEADWWSGDIGSQGKITTYSIMVSQFGLAVGFKFGKDAAALRKSREDLDLLTTPK